VAHRVLDRAQVLADDERAGDDDVSVNAHRVLAHGATAVAVGTLDDALEVTERPNMPGTTDEWPNWKLALPLPLEEIETDERVRAVSSALQESR
jgi:4-alpha-glucanotransferase